MPNGRKFTTEFKVKAVELVKKSEKPIARIAKDLNIVPSTLGRWIKEYDKLKEALKVNVNK